MVCLGNVKLGNRVLASTLGWVYLNKFQFGRFALLMPTNAFNLGDNVPSEDREDTSLESLLEPKEKLVIYLAICNISNVPFPPPLSLQNGSHWVARCDFLCTIVAYWIFIE